MQKGCFLRVMGGRSVGVCPSHRESITEWKVINLEDRKKRK